MNGFVTPGAVAPAPVGAGGWVQLISDEARRWFDALRQPSRPVTGQTIPAPWEYTIPYGGGLVTEPTRMDPMILIAIGIGVVLLVRR